MQNVKMGRRTKDWVKFKRMANEEFIVAGYIRKGAHTFSLVLAKYRDGSPFQVLPSLFNKLIYPK